MVGREISLNLNDPEAEILDYSLVKARTKSLSVSYMLCIFFGIFGLHHIYLRRLGYGLTYMLTGGLLGVGWIVDIIRLPQLVRSANDKIIRANRDGVDLSMLERERLLQDAYVMFLPPFGLLGFHHFYMHRFGFGVLYFFTLGLFGMGWLLDFFRLPHLVTQANWAHQKMLKRLENEGTHDDITSPRNPPNRRKLHDAIVLCFGPGGIFGFHHFYLGNILLGFFYILTLGNCGVCWIADMFRIRQLVREANNEIDEKPGGRKINSMQAYLLWFPPAGLLGAHQFYLERPCSGLIRSATAGLLIVGWIYDFFKIPGWVESYNRKQEPQEYIAEIEMEMTNTDQVAPKISEYDPDMVNPFKKCC